MPRLYAYQKFIDELTTKELVLPEDGGQELCTLSDGRTVAVVRDGFTLPEDQPEQIKGSIKELKTVSEALHDEICEKSSSIQLISQRVVDMIRSRYSVNDEIKALRLAPSPETEAWNAWVEECRDWGRAERAKLGL
jgi:hypothetical protein